MQNLIDPFDLLVDLSLQPLRLLDARYLIFHLWLSNNVG